MKRLVTGKMRRNVLNRSNGKCIKCGTKSKLDVHHLIPCYLGGPDIESNLVALCSYCHKEAPDDPIEFIKWATTQLPPDWDRNKAFTKICITILYHRENMVSKIKDTVELIDTIYEDLWRLFCPIQDGTIDSFSKLNDALAKFSIKYPLWAERKQK